MKTAFVSFALSALVGLAPSADAVAGNLWPGEETRTAAGFPFITKFIKTKADAPLVVFIAGRNSLARIGYGGHEGGLPQDFLADWLNTDGYNFLGISYPVETASGAFDAAHPDFTMRAWGRGAAELTQAVMKDNGLTGRVIVAVWSMGGRSVQPYAEAVRELDIDLDFHVSPAATPPIPGILDPGDFKATGSGLAEAPAGAGPGVRQMSAADKANGRTVIDPKILASQYLGHTPAQLIGRGLRYDKATKTVVENPWADMQDSKFYDLDSYPIVAMLVPGSQGDSRHAVTDQGSWVFYLTHTIFGRIAGGAQGAAKLPVERFDSLKKITRDAPARLSIEVPGNHFFFVGEKGAKATADAIKELEVRVHALKAELSTALGTEVR